MLERELPGPVSSSKPELWCLGTGLFICSEGHPAGWGGREGHDCPLRASWSTLPPYERRLQCGVTLCLRCGLGGLHTELPHGHHSKRLALLPCDPAVPSRHPTISAGRAVLSFQALPTCCLLQAACSDRHLSLPSLRHTQRVHRMCKPSEHWQEPCSESQGGLGRRQRGRPDRCAVRVPRALWEPGWSARAQGRWAGALERRVVRMQKLPGFSTRGFSPTEPDVTDSELHTVEGLSCLQCFLRLLEALMFLGNEIHYLVFSGILKNKSIRMNKQCNICTQTFL